MKKLIATTALALIIGGPAAAQDTSEESAILPPAGEGAEAGAAAPEQPGAAEDEMPETTEAETTEPETTEVETTETDTIETGTTEPETAEGAMPETGEAETEAAEGGTVPADDVEAVEVEEPAGTGAAETEAAQTGTAEPVTETEAAGETDVDAVTGGLPAQEQGDNMTATATEGDTFWRGDREVLAAPTMEREGFTPVEASEMSIETLMGAEVYDANDDSIGSVSDMVLDDTGEAQFAVIDVGGFLGLGARSVALGFDEMQILRGEGDELRVYVDATEETIESMPEYEAAEN